MTADLDTKRDRVFEQWVLLAENGDDRYSDHPPRSWLDENLKVRDITDLLPDAIEVVDERQENCIELFQDANLAHVQWASCENIPLGEAWDYAVWSDGEVDASAGAYYGLKEAVNAAVEHAQEQNLPILCYTSITRFENKAYREEAL